MQKNSSALRATLAAAIRWCSIRSAPRHNRGHPNDNDHVPTTSLLIKLLGRVEYQETWHAMQQFTASRNAHTRDEIWIVEHEPVYTAGVAARPQHFPRGPQSDAIPLMHIDRGGQITYHGPGQAVVYALIDLNRRNIKVREFVSLLEQAVIDLLAEYSVPANRLTGAPGVYVGGAKIAALGLKVKKQGCYHGVSLNVDLDTAPFEAIDPCGYPGLAITRTRDLGIQQDVTALGRALAQRIAHALEERVRQARLAARESCQAVAA
jgi:lipoyl(octanoyl) transferase